MSREKLNNLLRDLGKGEIFKTKSGKICFRLSSYSQNPILKPQQLGLTWYEKDKLYLGAVFNPGAVEFGEKILLLPRCHKYYKKSYFKDKRKKYYFEDYLSEIWVLVSEDGVKFEKFRDIVIKGDGTVHRDFTYGIEDIRVVEYKDSKDNRGRYILMGCGKTGPAFISQNSDRVAIYTTGDFVNITYHGMINRFDSRDAIPFFFDNKVYMIFRFYPNIYLVELKGGLDQLLNPDRYAKYWDEIYLQRSQNLLLEAGKYPHEREKIGASIPLIKTDTGWLMIYHGVGEVDIDIAREYGLRRSIKRCYSICCAFLDLEKPHQVIRRTKFPIYIPSLPYELSGNKEYPVDIPNVVFPTGSILVDDKLLIYCGAGDKYVILLSCSISALVDYLLKN